MIADDRLLHVAKFLWRRGQPLPTDLAMALAARGYDVQSLEDKYKRT